MGSSLSGEGKAGEGGTVIITDRGEPSMALIPIAEYRRLTGTDKSLVELLRMPELGDGNVDFEPVRIEAREFEEGGTA